MKKFYLILSVAVLLSFFPFCGKKGPIQPPLVLVPQTVENFKAFQQGDKIIIEWSNPTAYIDGSALAAVSEVEIWVFEQKNSSERNTQAARPKDFEKEARLVAAIKKEQLSSYQKKKEKKANEFLYVFPLTEKNLAASQMIFAIRVKDEKRKKSELSNLSSVKPQALPLPPGSAQAAVFEDRIEVSWEAPVENIDHSTPAKIEGYNLYKAEKDAFPQLLNSSLIRETRYEDRDFLFGRVYRYYVRAATSASEPYLESDDSQLVEVLPKDIFPPAPPSGLAAIKSAGSITLVWEANQEKDLAGYKVWRRGENQAEFICLTSLLILENNFSDTMIEKNKRYEYAITALDGNGNESQKSKSVLEMIKE